MGPLEILHRLQGLMRRFKFFAVFLWSLALLVFSAWRFSVPLHGAAVLWRALAVDIALLAAALASGHKLLLRLRLYHASLLEEALYSLALGLACLSLFGAALGALGALFDWVLWLFLSLALIAQWEHLEYFALQWRRNLKARRPTSISGGAGQATLLALGLGLLAMLALCLAPPTHYDALVQHLALPQRAAATGSLLPLPEHLLSWLPSLPQPLWAMALVLQDAPWQATLAPALLNAAVGLMLCLALMEASLRWVREAWRWLAPALALSQPLLLLSFGVFSPDGWMAFYALLSLMAFLSAMGAEDSRIQGGWLALAALLASAAVASKAVGLEAAAALLCLFLWRGVTERGWLKPRRLLAGAGLFALPLLPWLLQGLWFKHNPFYPFGLSLGGHTLLAGGPRIYSEHIQSLGGGVPWWRLPYSLLFDPMAFGGGGHLGFWPWALLPLAFFWRFTREQKALLVYVGLGALAWLAGPRVLRYGLYLVPPAALLCVHGIFEMEHWSASRGWAVAWKGLVLAALFLGLGQAFVIITKDFRPWEVVAGLQETPEYLAQQGVPQLAAGSWIRARGGPKARVLVLGDARTAWLPAGALAATTFDEHPFRAWLKQAHSPEDLGAIVRRKGYDFLFLSRAEWARLDAQGSPLYWAPGDAVAQALCQAWVQSMALAAKSQLLLPMDAGLVLDLR
jgi:hypothetical protein